MRVTGTIINRDTPAVRAAEWDVELVRVTMRKGNAEAFQAAGSWADVVSAATTLGGIIGTRDALRTPRVTAVHPDYPGWIMIVADIDGHEI